jgi:hypothetical protein
LNENEAKLLEDGSGGEDVIVVFGGVRSIVQEKLAGVGSILPTPSVAWTSKL